MLGRGEGVAVNVRLMYVEFKLKDCRDTISAAIPRMCTFKGKIERPNQFFLPERIL